MGNIASADRGYGFGNRSLSQILFDHGGERFSVSVLYTNAASLISQFSWTGTPTFASAYALCFDGTLAFTGTSAQMFGTNGGLAQRTITDPGWTTDDKVQVALYEGSTCPTVVPTAPEMSVTGNGVVIADGDMSPSSGDHTGFGSAAVSGGSVSRVFSVENSGDGALLLTGFPDAVVVGGTNASDFTVTQPTIGSVPANSSASFTVTFDPSRTGPRTATLSIANNDANENPYNFAIRGTGTEVATAGFTVSPSALTVSEAGGEASFSVRLDTQPTAAVSVLLGSSDESTVKIKNPTLPSQTTLEFTTSNWATAQSVTVVGVNDDDENPGGQRIAGIEMTSISADSDYLVDTEQTVVTVTVRDDDAEVVTPPPPTADGTNGPRPSGYQFMAAGCEPVLLAADGTFNGRWDDDADCVSAYSPSRKVSRFFWFTLPAGRSEMTFTLADAGAGSRMWLWPQHTNGHVATGGSVMDARFLSPGVHFVEVDSTDGQGSFTLTMEGIGAGPAGRSCDDTLWAFTGTGSVKGRWDAGCTAGDGSGSYARYYDLVLTQPELVTVDVTSPDADPSVAVSTGDPSQLLASNDDYEGSSRRSRISRVLPAGTHRIAVGSMGTAQAGTFTLDVTVERSVSCADTHLTITGDVTLEGEWQPGCETGGAFLRHYDLEVTEASEVTVTVTVDSAEADPLMSLTRLAYTGGFFDARSSEVLEINDDYRGSTTRSRIVLTLAPGRYGIGALSKNAGVTGTFTLTLTGIGTGLPSCDDTLVSFSAEHTLTGMWNAGCEAARLPHEQPRFVRRYDLVVDQHRRTLALGLSSEDADPILRVYDESGVLVASDDDSGEGTASRIVRKLDRGRYRIEAAAKTAQTTGSFELSVVDGPNDFTDDVDEEYRQKSRWAIQHNWDGCTENALSGTKTNQVLDASCTSRHARGQYSQYYTFSVTAPSSTQEKLVTITVTGTGDNAIQPWIMLREGDFSDTKAIYDRRAAGNYSDTWPPEDNAIAGKIKLQGKARASVTRKGVLKRGATFTLEVTSRPGTAKAGNFTVSLNVATRARGQSGPTGPDTAPTVTDTSQLKTHYFVVGQNVSVTLPAADQFSGNGGPYAYNVWHKGADRSFADHTINGLSFDPVTRTLSGTPTAEGEWALSYVVHDGDANTKPADAFRERDSLKIVIEPDGQAIGDTGPDQTDPPQQSQTDPQGDQNDPQSDQNGQGDQNSQGDPQQSQSEPDPPAPSPPGADAGADFDAKRGETVTLTGTATPHADGSQTLAYQWTVSSASHDELAAIAADHLTAADQAQAAFTVMKRKHMTDRTTVDDGNWITFELTVTDGDGETHTDTVTLTIQGSTWTAN